jgi:hypothetical protein
VRTVRSAMRPAERKGTFQKSLYANSAPMTADMKSSGARSAMTLPFGCIFFIGAVEH